MNISFAAAVRATVAVLALALGLAGCSNSGLDSSSLATNAALVAGGGAPQKAKFNPFVEHSGTSSGRREVIQNPTLEQVMDGGPLPAMALGRSDAPVTVIKYASMTCPYCRQFQTSTFPELKRKYIDTGKVRFILREFPIGFQSGAATIALRCVPEAQYFAAYDALMRGQASWVSQEVRREPIWQIVRRFGLTRASFDACFADEKLIADLNAVKERGRTLGVIGTPNFFVGAKLHKRVLTMTDFDQFVADASARPVAARAR